MEINTSAPSIPSCWFMLAIASAGPPCRHEDQTSEITVHDASWRREHRHSEMSFYMILHVEEQYRTVIGESWGLYIIFFVWGHGPLTIRQLQPHRIKTLLPFTTGNTSPDADGDVFDSWLRPSKSKSKGLGPSGTSLDRRSKIGHQNGPQMS